MGRVRADGKYNFFVKNHLGSTMATVDDRGRYSSGRAMDYLAYGSSKDLKVNGADPVTQKFTGKELELLTGLYHFGWRNYDPELGMWISPESSVIRTSLLMRVNLRRLRVGVFSLLALLGGCGEPRLDYYKNDFVMFPILKSIRINAVSTPYSKKCVYISDIDTVFDVTVCEFERANEGNLQQFFTTSLEYAPPGYQLKDEKETEVFSTYRASGRSRLLYNKEKRNEMGIYTHRVENGYRLVGILSRTFKRLPSEEWIELHRKWENSWRFTAK